MKDLVGLACLALSAGQLASAVATQVSSSVTGDSSVLHNVCDACEWGVRSVEDFIADPHHQDVLESAVDAVVCAKGDDKHCKSYVHTGVRRIVELFEDYVNPRELCEPVCFTEASAASTAAATASSGKLRDWQCPFCEFVAAQADKALQDAKTDEEILDYMRTTCRDLPPSFADPCVEYVDTQGAKLIALLATMPPEQVCEVLGECHQGALHTALLATPPPPRLPKRVALLLADLGAVKRAQTCSASAPTAREALGVREAGVTALKLAPEPSEACEICRAPAKGFKFTVDGGCIVQVAVAQARKRVADPQFQSEVEHYMMQLCKQAGGYEDICRDSVQQYAPLVFAAALDYLRPVYLCTDLTHVCPRPPAA